MPGSVRFDRVAEEYDRTRGISDDAMARTIEQLSSELEGRGRVLEVGVGTGLLALPLHEAGLALAGIDLTEAMLAKLVEKAGGRPPFHLVLGDAARMPFADGSYDAAYLRWVLHLIPDWRVVVAEIARVLRPGAVFLAHLGSYTGPDEEIRRRFAEIAGVPDRPVGLTWRGHDELDREMERHGASVRVLSAVIEEGEGALGEFLDGIEENLYSWTWNVPDDVRLGAAAEVRAWARDRFGPLDVPMKWEQPHEWRAYDLPGREG